MKTKILSKHLELAMKLANQSIWKSYREFRHLYVGQGYGRMVFTDGTYAYKIAKYSIGIHQNQRELDFIETLETFKEKFPVSKIIDAIFINSKPMVLISEYIEKKVYLSKKFSTFINKIVSKKLDLLCSSGYYDIDIWNQFKSHCSDFGRPSSWRMNSKGQYILVDYGWQCSKNIW